MPIGFTPQRITGKNIANLSLHQILFHAQDVFDQSFFCSPSKPSDKAVISFWRGGWCSESARGKGIRAVFRPTQQCVFDPDHQ
jgi:hypothetical protein